MIIYGITRNYGYQYHVRVSVAIETYSQQLLYIANDVMVSVHFRDGIEDEWFIVSLMCQLTQHFTDLVVR